ncbi:MAG: tRNA epoxyqueuosine(34) reductase QueG [Verrucomicrobiota bacterium]
MKAELREQVVARATEIGFDLCRFTRAAEPAHAAEFRDWLSAGHAGEMNYLQRNAERRCDPQLVLPGARSIIVLAQNYFQGPLRAQAGSSAAGTIARYAWGADYHLSLESKLRQLDAFLVRCGGRQRFYVDTGPVLERDHAAAAGIGWQGKNTMLLNRTLGTWFFLAEILTTLEFDLDQAEPDRCGSCTRCLDACPTQAFTGPHQLDARRCISYLTIELKGSIPVELRPLLGDHIYGCDVCLDVCPWNRFATLSRETTSSMGEDVARMTLRDYLALTEESFRLLFRNSPIRRTKRRGLLRNVCVALGNVGTTDDLAALRKASVDSEPLIAEHARWAIEQIESRAQKVESTADSAPV